MINTVVRQLIQCPVPIFLAISGFFLCRKKLKERNDIYKFWKKQIPTVYIPCLIWSVPWLLLAVVHSIRHNELMHLPIDIANFFLCGYQAYYFILLIIQCYLLLPFLLRCKSLNKTLIITAITYIIQVTIVQYMFNSQLPVVVYGAPFTLLGFYFILGIKLGQNDRNYSLLLPICGVILGLVLQILETYFKNVNYEGGFGIKPSSIVYCASVIVLLFSKRFESWYNNNENNFGRFFRYIGGLSFGIYLIHFYFLFALQTLHLDLGFYGKWAVVFFSSILAVAIGKKLFPKYGVKYLGLR